MPLLSQTDLQNGLKNGLEGVWSSVLRHLAELLADKRLENVEIMPQILETCDGEFYRCVKQKRLRLIFSDTCLVELTPEDWDRFSQLDAAREAKPVPAWVQDLVEAH